MGQGGVRVHPPGGVPDRVPPGGGPGTPRGGTWPVPPGGDLTGYPPRGGGTQVGQQKEYSLHGGRYASCVHAGGLSCYESVSEQNPLSEFGNKIERWQYPLGSTSPNISKKLNLTLFFADANARAVLFKVTRNIDTTHLNKPQSQLTVGSDFECAAYCVTSCQGFIILLEEDINNCRLFQELPVSLSSSNENKNLLFATLM